MFNIFGPQNEEEEEEKAEKKPKKAIVTPANQSTYSTPTKSQQNVPQQQESPSKQITPVKISTFEEFKKDSGTKHSQAITASPSYGFTPPPTPPPSSSPNSINQKLEYQPLQLSYKLTTPRQHRRVIGQL